MKLLVDQGNSKIKWRLCDDVVLHEGSSANDSDWRQWFIELERGLGQESRLDSVVVASVAGQVYRPRFTAEFQRSFGVTPAFFETEARRTVADSVLVNSYLEPSAMGVDRWLALVAVIAEFPGQSAVIVDAGSAINIELLGADGYHKGGYILPGLQMMKSSLLNNTSKVVFERSQNVIMVPGKNTADSVSSGVVLAALGAIDRALDGARGAGLQGDIVFVLAGGDAPALIPCYEAAVHRPNLVLDGLSIIDADIASN